MTNLDELIDNSVTSTSGHTAVNRHNIVIRIVYVLGTISLITAVGLYVYYLQKEASQRVIEILPDNRTSSKGNIVDLSGAVKTPGVYTLSAASRVADVIEAGGGLTAEANKEWVEKNLNLASFVSDGQKIYIPAENEAMPVKATAANPGALNLNLATAAQLDAVPGISPAMAQKIIDYRQQQGPFTVVEELKNISGIGEATFTKIKPYVLVP
jgi:competence protein ComEA